MGGERKAGGGVDIAADVGPFPFLDANDDGS